VILSDEHRFAFIHIPKCAGTSVRKALRPIDETVGQFDHIADHPAMGRINYGHLTLRDLAAYFPHEYAKILSFRSVAILRDPVDRFFSALFQRLREFKGYGQSQITSSVVSNEAEMLARTLVSTSRRLPLEYVHFNRQSDYVFNNGQQIVGRTFALDRIDEASDYIEACTGVRLAADARENRTAALKIPALRPVVRALHKPYAALVPYALRNRVRSELTRAGIFGDLDMRDLVKIGSPLDAFLRDYYRDDFELFAKAVAA
jgi:Sulfotransferase family